ncbi:phosphoribosyltransferase family protein [Shewanella xiamenensis]|uniref:phosphoribosyltransferase family protein n=1 Tax=Shewanella TaxID=22 RepID=UPI0021DA65FF|nr:MULTISPECIES: phosphoribosyltransferase family protein [Shewanella]MCU8040404.1 phosphoribosyltransferase family protein [Shewanella sp. SM69]MCU8045746.1 phosphoribosyltransferase family protein [Shewanella sp. SM68]MCU8050076.1 phosphoribosyltransferase family protein [Shewanella sp. SM65]MDH1316110.1 phosphoribosyltransferase family protein [Shewanella xiamenensis]
MNTSFNRNWKELLDEVVPIQLSAFHAAKKNIHPEQVKAGFRAFAANLLKRDLISMADYVAVFGGHALNHLTPMGPEKFYSMSTCNDAQPLTEVYSRAKYGGVSDIRFLAKGITEYLCAELDDECSSWSSLFRQAKMSGEHVVLMTTGWRNVPSASNVLYEIVVEDVNMKLAHMGFPTIINVKLPRIAPPCENYATLSLEERNLVNLSQDHVIPAKNFYRFSGVHVIFGDDVLVTGATADKVMYESLLNGAKSFRAIYSVAIDPRVALNDASVEERLNSTLIKQNLDSNLAILLSEPGYQPILRTLRLIFENINRDSLSDFLPQVPLATWVKLYKSALNNEFLSQAECVQSLVMLRDYLTKNRVLNDCGMVMERR